MRRLIRGKFDSRWKQEFNTKIMKSTGKLEQGYFMTAITYARKNRGGMALIRHARNQPWETWTSRKGKRIPPWSAWLTAE